MIISTSLAIDGISPEDEKKQRIFGCELCCEAGIRLKLPQGVIATAQSVLHRYYHK